MDERHLRWGAWRTGGGTSSAALYSRHQEFFRRPDSRHIGLSERTPHVRGHRHRDFPPIAPAAHETDTYLPLREEPRLDLPAALITTEINRLSAEKDGIEASLTSARSVPQRSLNIAEVEIGLRDKFSQLRKELEGLESEAASAREAIRALVDRVVIAPVGDPKSRTGSLSIRVEGKITALLGFSASDQVHAILS